MAAHTPAGELHGAMDHPGHLPVPVSLSAAAIVTLAARLRLACDALGVSPDDVRLEDLAEDQRQRLLREAEGDFWQIIHNEGNR